jgi:soluble lytic murein transglycosylase-like protein
VLARRLLAGCAVLGCIALTGEAELSHEAPAAPSTPALPATGDAATIADAPAHPRLPPLTRAERHEILGDLLADAARRQGLDPGLVQAVAWWESGWDMSRVSSTGATGLMQVDPATAHDLGPELLHRTVDITNPYDNAELGAAVLKADIADAGGNLAVALASYYEGSGNVDPSNLDPGAQTYVEGVTSLQRQFDSGRDPTLQS